MVFLAEHMLKQAVTVTPLAILGSEIPFPFNPKPSRILVEGIPDAAIACMPLLEDWGIASRLTSRQGYPGCHDGFVTDLARHWLSGLDEEQPPAGGDIQLRAHTPCCGPVAELAGEFSLPCQVSLEEYMACGVGGCAGLYGARLQKRGGIHATGLRGRPGVRGR